MKLNDLMKNTRIILACNGRDGCYIATLICKMPSGNEKHFTLELTKCYTMQIVKDTIVSTLEELLGCRYDYSEDTIDLEDILYNGGTFK